jgi:ethylmalonyl-CoA mutase
MDQSQQDGRENLSGLRARLTELEKELGRRPKLLVGEPGRDGQSGGAEQIALKARDVGFEVVYAGSRITPEQIAASALEEGVHLIGLSVAPDAASQLVAQVLEQQQALGLAAVPLVVVGAIPTADVPALEARGLARLFSAQDFAREDMSTLIALVADRFQPSAAE